MLQTFTSEGLIISSASFEGLPGAIIRSSPLHGVWDRTGPSTFATTNLVLVYDFGSDLLIGFGRARATFSLAKHYPDHASGTVQVEFLSCPSPFACPDPQAADAAWAPFPGMPLSLQVTATRLRLPKKGRFRNHSTAAAARSDYRLPPARGYWTPNQHALRLCWNAAGLRTR